MSQSPSRLEQILEAHIQTLTLTLRPSTVTHYRSVARGFLGYLQVAFPQLRQPSVNDPVKTGFSVTPAGIARQDRHRRCDPSVNGQALVWKWCSFVEGGME